MGPLFFDRALEALQDIVDRRHEIDSANPGGASCVKIAKVFSRMASIYVRKQEYSKAMEMYNHFFLPRMTTA